MGVILFTIGSVAGFFMNINIVFAFHLALLSLPITGFWMLFVAAKTQGALQKILLPIKLLRIYATISLVMAGTGAKLGYVISIAIAIISTSASASLFNAAMTGPGKGMGEAIGAMVFIGLALMAFIIIPFIAAAAILYMALYLAPMLKIIKGIENNALLNSFGRLHGIRPFMVMSFIGIGILMLDIVFGFDISNILLTLVDIGYSTILEISQIPALQQWAFQESQLHRIYESALIAHLAIIFSLASVVGLILCMVSLLRFNNDLQKTRRSNLY